MTKAKKAFTFITLLLTAALILPCFAGCSEAPTEKDNPGMLTIDAYFINGAMYSYYAPIHVTLNLSDTRHFNSVQKCRV